jgi:exopolysaccharide biosynthesis protein
VREVREGGNTRLPPGILVLSLGPVGIRNLPRIELGAVLEISTVSSPSLRGARTALSGGPVLLQDGKPRVLHLSNSYAYEYRSMLERHPRAAIGWNKKCFFLVEVDGRQWHLSVGMTLEELSDFMVTLGCEEAMNLDGGGSATFWYSGRIRNSPCDGMERPIANSLIIVKKTVEMGKANDVHVQSSN